MSPFNARPVRIPGVGDQFELEDEDGGRVVVVARHDGGCEIISPDGDTRLSAATTQSMCAALAGHVTIAPELIDRLEGVMGGGLMFDWVTIDRDSVLVDRSIASLDIRKHTGVTIVAILRGSLPIVAPEPTELIHTGDELVVVGQAVNVQRFPRSLEGHG